MISEKSFLSGHLHHDRNLHSKFHVSSSSSFGSAMIVSQSVSFSFYTYIYIYRFLLNLYFLLVIVNNNNNNNSSHLTIKTVVIVIGFTPSHRIRGLRVQTWPGSMDFSHKNPEYDFLRKGSKAVGPVS